MINEEVCGINKVNDGAELMETIGIYGGTFDPPHAGHYVAAAAFAAAAGLDRLLIIPAANPPHKNPARASGIHRLNMCRLAFAELPRAEVCEYELERGGASYTVDTLEHFTKAEGRIALLCGCDMLLTLDTWRRPADIFALADIYYMRRETGGSAEIDMDDRIAKKIAEYTRLFGARIFRIDAPPVEISSTELRGYLTSGEDCRGFLKPKVADYIKINRIYTKHS